MAAPFSASERLDVRLVPPPLEAYAVPAGAEHAASCARCLTVGRKFAIRVYADWREIRLCVACWKAWGDR